MKAGEPVAPRDPAADIPSLIETLLATERRLEELTAGEVDTVAGSDGRTFMLRRAQEQFRQTEAVKQAGILNALPAHIALLDDQGRILSVNDAWQRFARANLMQAPGLGIGLNYVDVCDAAEGPEADEAHAVAAGLRAVLSGLEDTFSIEYDCPGPHQERWFLLTVTALAGGRPRGAVVMHMDVTAHKRSERALRELSEKTERRERVLSTALSSMSDFAQVYDRQGRLVFANQPLLDLWGVPLEEVVGQNFFDLGYPVELAARLQRQLEEVFETTLTLTDETTYTSPTGLKGCYEYIFSPVFAADGSVDLVVGSTREITERKHTEHVLRESEEHFRFLNSLGEATRTESDPEQIMAVVSRLLGEHLHVSRCAYAVVAPDGDRFTILHDYTDGCASTVGNYHLSLFGARALATLQGGGILIIRDADVELSAGDGREEFAAIGIRAIISCPLVKNGVLCAIMAVHQTTPRDWTAAEVAIVQEVVERSWATIERTTAQESLRESEALRRMAGRAGKLGGWSVELPEVRITWSDEVCAIHDVPAGTVPDLEQAINFYPPSSRAVISKAFGACMTEGTAFDLELEVVTAWGRPIWVRTIGEAQRNAAGAITRVEGAFQDITERRRSAEALQASLEEFHTLTEAMPQMVWITRADGWTVYFNQQWMAYTGLSLEESLGHGWSQPFHPEDRKGAEATWQHATETGEVYSLECRLRRADGAYRWWLIRGVPVRDGSGSLVKWFGTCTDVHDLKLAQLAISESEQRFAKIFQSGLVAIGITDASSGRIIDANARFAEFFGYARDEMVGRTVLELGLWADMAARARFFADPTDGRTARTVEGAYRRKSGELRQGVLTMEGLTLPGIAAPLKISKVVDVTERKQLESQLLQAQKMDAVGRLAGGVAHDFNNSLGVILGYTELLIPTATEPQRRKLEQILKASNRAAGLTRQLLAFSRKQIVDPQVLDLNARLSDLQQMLGRLIGEHITLELVPGADLGQVKADLGQLEQVVVNLCVNARDAMPGGGHLRIETANVEVGPQAGLDASLAPGRYVLLSVSDTGSGIARDILPNIFEPFFTTKEVGKGTGLGLAMAYGVVTQAGGSIGVASEPGHGTTFTIHLPRIDDPSVPDVPTTPMPSRGWETVLLVEDEDSMRAIARETLETHGYQVLEAGGAAEAVEIAGRHRGPLHLLLTDVVMPGMNGRALAESLVSAHPHMRVLYMSGYTDDVIAHSGVLEAGFLLIEKPFTARALLGRVRSALGETPAA